VNALQVVPDRAAFVQPHAGVTRLEHLDVSSERARVRDGRPEQTIKNERSAR
jgi:hypothetical protein